jgi:hypothetical protein
VHHRIYVADAIALIVTNFFEFTDFLDIVDRIVFVICQQILSSIADASLFCIDDLNSLSHSIDKHFGS